MVDVTNAYDGAERPVWRSRHLISTPTPLAMLFWPGGSIAPCATRPELCHLWEPKTFPPIKRGRWRAQGWREQDLAGSRTQMTTIRPTSVAAIRAGMLQCILLLFATIVPWPADWDELRSTIDSTRSPEFNRAEREAHAAGYYEGLIGGVALREGTRGEQSLRLLGKPDGWVRFQEANVVHYLEDDFLQFELKPLVERMLFGQPFVTNAYGMHDDPITAKKPAGSLPNRRARLFDGHGVGREVPGYLRQSASRLAE